MTKKSFTTVATIGFLALASVLSFAQTFKPAGAIASAGSGMTAAQATAAASAVLPRPGYKPPQIIPITKLPIEVRAYNSLTATQGLVANLNTLVQQGQITFCPVQLAVLAQALYPLGDAVTQIDTAATEYNNQIALLPDQRDWTYFWLLVNAAYSDFQEASGYYNQAVQTTC